MRHGVETVIGNPFSGQYEGSNNNAKLELNVDLDKLREHSTVLNTVSGTLSGYKPGTDSSVCFFQSISGTLKVVSEVINSKRTITSDLRVVAGDGERSGGKLELILMLPQDDGTWNGRAKVSIENTEITFETVSRSSLFFKEVTLDIDYIDKLVWPVLVLDELPNETSKRKIDVFSAFEDAGLKIRFNEANTKKIKDPTPGTPWTKSDMYGAMMSYFDEGKDSDENIWCMMGTTPPDKRYMGFSFDLKGRHGFGIFTGHKSFDGYDSCDPLTRALASRRLLHYFVHECGHCLELEHPFELGKSNALSWMNYAWKYDETHQPGSFYESFRFQFSEMELRLLRHSPSSKFRRASKSELGYALKSSVPDVSLADDDSDNDEENVRSQATRKISLDLKIKDSIQLVGESVTFEARIRNVGILPVLVERDLTIEAGNLKVYVTRPDGSTQVVKSLVRPIQSGYTRPMVLYSASTASEGTDRYSDMISIGTGSTGTIFSKPGRYTIRALYSGGRYNATSDEYDITVNPTQTSEAETDEEVSIATELGSASYNRFRRVQTYWKELAQKAVEEKQKRIDVFIKLAADLVKTHSREAESESSGSERGEMKLRQVAAVKTPQEILGETSDLLEYMQNRGTKSDNFQYSRLVMARCELNLMLNNVKQSEAEFYRMISDLLARGVKEPVLTKLQKQWKGLPMKKNTEGKYTSISLQKRLDEVLSWAPTLEGDGETELSGIGLGRPFNNFDQEHIKKGVTIIEMLFNQHEETKDLVAVLRYADKLQKSREVNHHVLHWALEAFIVHCMAAKKAGIKYPEPKDMDQSMISSAAMIATKRTGQPSEDWMLYWRSDADFNYHHRHWHVVYIVGRFVRGVSRNSPVFSTAPPHLERQGELFGYMHSQMLARYDAERESWGLSPVEPWEYNGIAAAFNAGLEFHSDPQHRFYAPRPTAGWPTPSVRQFEQWERAYNTALNTGVVVDGVELTPNWSGHVLEPSSSLYADIFGNLHNTGHGVFGSTGIAPNLTTYMNDSANACRDPIFFRWHKRVDNLWQANNDYYRVDIASDAPPVVITQSDIVIDTSASPPENFDGWNGDWVDTSTRETKTIQTNLGPPSKRFEWDNKLSHEAFYYHLRVRRNPERGGSNALRLTFRIFIVPKNRELERRRYIEMDKFVYTLAAGVDHAVLTRADRHSSVIKRVPAEMTDNVEAQFATESAGFCECGWPYHMLLPRGNSDGQEYSLCVIVSDNAIDSIGFRTTCGSMSFCGARGRPYPDSRYMGYPFSTPMQINGQNASVTDVIDQSDNAARVSFVIQNNIGEAPSIDALDYWSPFGQLGLNDGTIFTNAKSEYRLSSWTGRFRVLVDNAFIRSATNNIMLRFQGRGARGGAYRIRDVKIGRRVGTSLNVESNTSVLSNGNENFVVPEDGLLSDNFSFSLDPALNDYFVTFTLDDPGVYLPASSGSQTIMTYRTPDSRSVTSSQPDWTNIRNPNRSSNVYCLSGIMGQN